MKSPNGVINRREGVTSSRASGVLSRKKCKNYKECRNAETKRTCRKSLKSSILLYSVEYHSCSESLNTRLLRTNRALASMSMILLARLD